MQCVAVERALTALALVGRRASGSGQLSAHACRKLRQSTVEHGGGWRLARRARGSAYIIARVPSLVIRIHTRARAVWEVGVTCVKTQRDAWGTRMGLPLFHKLPLGAHGFTRLTVGLSAGGTRRSARQALGCTHGRSAGAARENSAITRGGGVGGGNEVPDPTPRHPPGRPLRPTRPRTTDPSTDRPVHGQKLVQGFTPPHFIPKWCQSTPFDEHYHSVSSAVLRLRSRAGPYPRKPPRPSSPRSQFSAA